MKTRIPFVGVDGVHLPSADKFQGAPGARNRSRAMTRRPLLLVAVAVLAVLMAAPELAAQEYPEETPEFDEPLTTPVIDRNQLSDAELAAINQAYVVLYNRRDFQGFSRQVNLSDGPRITLNRCSRLHDNVRSMRIFGDRHVSVVLLEKALVTYANQKHAVFWTLNRSPREINKRELTYLKMFREASALEILYDGFLLNLDVQNVEC